MAYQAFAVTLTRDCGGTAWVRDSLRLSSLPVHHVLVPEAGALQSVVVVSSFGYELRDRGGMSCAGR